MQADWRGLINALIGDYKLESPDEGAEQEHDDRLRRQAEQMCVGAQLRSMRDVADVQSGNFAFAIDVTTRHQHLPAGLVLF